MSWQTKLLNLIDPGRHFRRQIEHIRFDKSGAIYVDLSHPKMQRAIRRGMRDCEKIRLANSTQADNTGDNQ